jgi:hypothetical protein
MTKNDFLLVVSIAVFIIVVLVFDQTRTPIAESAYQPNFLNKNTNMSIQKLAFGAGCFWGTEKCKALSVINHSQQSSRSNLLLH